jgi:hypothetical protein
MDVDNRAVLANLIQMEKAARYGLKRCRAAPTVKPPGRAAREARQAYRHKGCESVRAAHRLAGY